MRQIGHLALFAAFGVCSILGVGPSSAQPSSAPAWPQRTVRVIVPNPPGVALDVIGRLFAERLAARWGNAVVVENIPGADGIPAVREFATRDDDHTLLYSFAGPITINPVAHPKLPYDPVRDLLPIASTSDNFLAIAVSSSVSSASLAELAQLAKSSPGKLAWAATPGLPHYGFTAYRQRTGVNMVHVPYRDFNQAFVDLGEGRISAVASGMIPLMPHVRAGKVRLLAVLNRVRSPVAPDVPTVAEAGYPELTFEAVTGFFGGRNMPAALRGRIASDVAAIAADPVIKERLTKMGSMAISSTPAEFSASIDAQRARIAAIADALKPER